LATRDADIARAVRLARAELEARADVFTHDALAWALAKEGDMIAAAEQMRAALAEGTKEARLFFHAGEIAWACHEHQKAAEFFAQARTRATALTPSERTQLEMRLALLDRADLAESARPARIFLP
jgi:predicted TPR repeat methyltransferase